MHEVIICNYCFFENQESLGFEINFTKRNVFEEQKNQLLQNHAFESKKRR
jgi:hypothetical protein